jgi:hypothetical protein
MMTVTESLRVLGQRFFGRAYLAPLARRLGTDTYTLRRWLQTGKGPADLPDRRDELLRELMKERLRDVVSAATMLAKLQSQTSIWDRDRANKVLAFFAMMYPQPLYDDKVSIRPDMSTPPKSIDELCEGLHPLVAQCLRETLEEVE